MFTLLLCWSLYLSGLSVVAHRATVAWFVLRRGVKKMALATFSRAALTDRCLVGQYASSSKNDVPFSRSM